MSMRSIRTIENAAWANAEPKLSVVMPFFRYDPAPLLERLDTEARKFGGAIEILALDDGGGDKVLAERVAELVSGMTCPTRLILLTANEGRARGRNRLVDNARARHILLIDCDMAPDAPDFLAQYMALVDEDVAVAFGGFSVDRTAATADQELHRALQLRAECLPARLRRLQPEKYVYTSNLLVRRDVFEAEAFDEGFTGWGWEDVEWGMRVASRFDVRQIENTATHLGLDTATALATKYEQSVANFARVVANHPEVVINYPSYRMARILKRLPQRALFRSFLKQLALRSHAPLMARIFAMKAYRAALYAEVV
jgi:glycosyltransferase involved in cell wall biosynthesis